MIPVRSSRRLAALALGLGLPAILAAGCQSTPPPQDAATFDGTVLDRNAIQVEAATEMMEVTVDPQFATLRAGDRRRIEGFVSAYRDRGHGRLVMILPENFPEEGLAVEMLKEAREIAWRRGVAYEEMDEQTYDARGTRAPLVLAFDVYEAVAPDCKSIGAYDLGDISSNNEQAWLGCSVRNNMAAMIADPGDLLGQRTLGPRDNRRVGIIMEAYRQGQPTGAATGEEDVAVSEVGD